MKLQEVRACSRSGGRQAREGGAREALPDQVSDGDRSRGMAEVVAHIIESRQGIKRGRIDTQFGALLDIAATSERLCAREDLVEKHLVSIRQASVASVGPAISGSMQDQGYVEMKQKRGEQPCGRRRAPCSHQERTGSSKEMRAARARPCKAKRPPPRQLPLPSIHVGMPPLTRHVHRNVIAPAALARGGAHMKIERGTPCRRA